MKTYELSEGIKLWLTHTEMQALRQAAALHCRRPQDQARVIIRSALLGESPPTIDTNEKSAMNACVGNGALVGKNL